MILNSTVTFEKTWDAYYQECTNEEYAQKLLRYIRDEIPGIASRYKARQVVSMGGSRSSKSYSILQLLLVEMMTRKNIKITVWRNTKVTCRATIMEDFSKIIMADENVYADFKENKQKATFTYLPTGSKILFEGADSIGVVLGSEQTISFFNEVTEFNKEVYLHITQRTSDRVICDYNPSKNFWLESYRHDEDTIFIHSNFRHNAYCPPNIITQLLSYEPWERGSYEVRGAEVFYNNQPVSPNNQPPRNEKNWKKGTANVYLWLVYGLGIGSEKPNKIYQGWTKISQEYFDNLPYLSYFGLDFGASNPTACVEVKYDGDGAFYICERLYMPLQEIEDSLPTAIQLKVPQIKKRKSYIVCDSAKEKYIDLLLEAGFLAIGATKGGGSIEVGITLVQGFTIYYVPSDNLDFEYANYSWSIDRYGKSTDVPVKVDDHLMDALRYIISYLTEFLRIKL